MCLWLTVGGVREAVDGIGVFKTGLSATGSVNADIEGNYIHDLCYASSDPNHSDNHTHNDGIQIQGGNIPSSVTGWIAWPARPPTRQ